MGIVPQTIPVPKRYLSHHSGNILSSEVEEYPHTTGQQTTEDGA